MPGTRPSTSSQATSFFLHRRTGCESGEAPRQRDQIGRKMLVLSALSHIGSNFCWFNFTVQINHIIRLKMIDGRFGAGRVSYVASGGTNANTSLLKAPLRVRRRC